MNRLLEALRGELAPRGVAVTTICPGFVRTPMTAKNKFPMPFLMEPEEAARRIVRAIAARRRVYAFPWPFSWIVRGAALLPAAIGDRLLR
jgi:Short-chain dehydrogenases of various substrate specificities